MVDDLPRDYVFKYLETNTGIFPRLVTYANCTAYPAYGDTNLLYFNGQKEISSGIFSWVVPRQDSLKLIYSARVSSTPRFNDTNFITAYVGSSPVGTAFAKVNVFTLLPLTVLDFTVDKAENGLQLSWKVGGNNEFAHFNIYRQSGNGEQFELISSFHASDYAFDYAYLDQDALNSNNTSFTYKLEKVEKNGHASVYYSSIDISKHNKGFDLQWIAKGSAGITGINPAIRSIHMTLSDVNGRILFDGQVQRTDSVFIIPVDLSSELMRCLFITVEQASGRSTEKLLVHSANW